MRRRLSWEYADLLRSGGDFDALPNRRVDPIRRSGNEDQFHKERAAEERCRGAPGAPHGTIDVEWQLQHQKQSEEHQNYSRQRAEEIRAREGGTPSPITYDVGSPAAPTKQKKKITLAKDKARMSKEPPQPAPEESDLMDLDERIRKQQAEVDYYQREVDRLKHEQEQLAREQQRIRYEQDRLEQERLHDLELMRQHELEVKRQHELGRKQRHEKRRLEKEEELRCRELKEQERLRTEQECLAAANNRGQFGSHTPLQDEHGEPLDYYDDTNHTEETWQHLQVTAPINIALKKSRQEALACEAALLKGPSQASTAAEEEVLLSEQVPAGLETLLRKIEDLPEVALSQLSQHIDVVRRQTPSLVSPSKSPGPPPGLPESTLLNTDITNRILKATMNLGQLPSCPVTVPPSEEETRNATNLLVEQMRVPGTPCPAAQQ